MREPPVWSPVLVRRGRADVSCCHHHTIDVSRCHHRVRSAHGRVGSRTAAAGSRQAALALYGERGFENTTVAEIAARAGLTERTFFRYFADKREVLFSGAGALQELLVSAVLDAPDSAAPIDAVAAALEAAGALLPGAPRFRPAAPDRHRRQHRAAGTRADQAGIARLGARRRVAPAGRRQIRPPRLTAEAGIAVFKVAFERWVDESNQRDLPQLIRESLDQLKAVTAGR